MHFDGPRAWESLFASWWLPVLTRYSIADRISSVSRVAEAKEEDREWCGPLSFAYQPTKSYGHPQNNVQTAPAPHKPPVTSVGLVTRIFLCRNGYGYFHPNSAASHLARSTENR
ncbi:hypothetical protein B0H63DRAFT_187753 [Podospora didyma]|uniref:Secreted protein n=1 Tax=Podospora didyma TaxID=330526 RepID=A0AAE0NQI4_9PEZI|nr:hypothetical protein B0H63DRAFT_187753 [Podospora didyma]